MIKQFGKDTALLLIDVQNRIGIDGTDYDHEIVYNISVAGMHGEFCTALSHKDILELTGGDVTTLNRAQGNE